MSPADWTQNEDIYEDCGWHLPRDEMPILGREDEHGKRELAARKKAGLWD